MSFAPPNSLESSTQDKILGAVVVIAIIVLGYFYYLSINTRESGKWYVFNAVLKDSYGIVQGTLVKYKGISIGSVHTVEVNEDGQIGLEVWLKDDFERLYVKDSKLVVDSTIGIGNVLSGTSLMFESALIGSPLTSGQQLDVTQPKSLNDLMTEWNVEKLSAQLVGMLDNLDAIVETIGSNQDNINQLMNNMTDMSTTMLQASGQFPSLLAEVEATLSEVKKTVQNTNKVIDSNAEELLSLERSSAELINGLSKLTEKADNTIDEFPNTLHSLNSVLSEAKLLTVQLRRHWLLGGSDVVSQNTETPILIRYPIDKNLYEFKTENESPKEQTREGH